MARPSLFILAFAVALVGSFSDAATVEKTFNVSNFNMTRLCNTTVVTVANQQVPGPAIEVEEGDSVVIHVINDSPYNMTLHWHGVFQIGTPWADGPNMITQCPILPGLNYTYRFCIIEQEGTLWWHAHVAYFRITLHGAIIIRPRQGALYPFPTPDKEETIVLAEWYIENIVEVAQQGFLTGFGPGAPDAYTINGLPGDSYNCSTNQTYKLIVEPGLTYLLRIINAALDTELFFKVANHSFTVVAADADYTNPYVSDVIVISPGQTVDALMVANATPGRYYMAISPYESAIKPYLNNTSRGIIEYINSPNSTQPPVIPDMPGVFDTATANAFYTNLTELIIPGQPTVPLNPDTNIFMTFGLGSTNCLPSQTQCNVTRGALATNFNNISFQAPTTVSLLQAYFENIPGVYTADFPDEPPIFFDFTGAPSSVLTSLQFTPEGTKVKRLAYNSTVEIVYQNTAVGGTENHPLHLHGTNFYVLAQGVGNYNKTLAEPSYNLVNPQLRNTVAVPAGGWAVIRFVANNPGVWFMHCHIDAHLETGLAMAIQIDNGPTPDTMIPLPPPDYPRCFSTSQQLQPVEWNVRVRED